MIFFILIFQALKSYEHFENIMIIKRKEKETASYF